MRQGGGAGAGAQGAVRAVACEGVHLWRAGPCSGQRVLVIRYQMGELCHLKYLNNIYLDEIGLSRHVNL